VAKVSVSPETFNLVFFEAAEIARIAERVADTIGLPADTEIQINVDERIPLGRIKTTSIKPIVLEVEGGSFEDAKRPRRLSDDATSEILARVLFRAKDRLSGEFDGAPADDDLSLQQQTAWIAYAGGRAERLGIPVKKPRWLYHFRNRHGFNDVSDQAFERLWSSDSLSWADIEQACADTAAARETAAPA
jgi:hypothetical protein